ncbi:MAG: hypothetical protein AAGC69_04205 [Paracraurococcus sp.]
MEESMVMQEPEQRRLLLPLLLVALAIAAWLLVLGSIVLAS